MAAGKARENNGQILRQGEVFFMFFEKHVITLLIYKRRYCVLFDENNA